MKKERSSDIVFKIMKYSAIGIVGILVGLILINWDKITVDNILSFSPQNPIMAGIFLLFLYFIKSITIVFPSAILYIASGKLYSLPMALIINSIGLLIILTSPYFIGHYFGNDLYQNLLERYPKMVKIEEFKGRSQWFFVVIARLLKVIPGDITSMALGSMDINYPIYLTLSFIVRFPPMLANTFLGTGIQTKNLTGFFISTGFTILISLVSGLVFYIQDRNKN